MFQFGAAHIRPVLIALLLLAIGLTSTSASAQRGRNQKKKGPIDITKLKDTEFEGQLKGMIPQQNLLVGVGATQQPVYILVKPGVTRTHVSGMADTSVLKPKLYVRFTANVAEDGTIAEPLKEIEVMTPYAPGQWPAVVAGEGEVAGQITGYSKEGEIKVRILAQGDTIKMVSGKVDENASVKLEISDLSIARPGSKLHVRGKEYEPTKIIAEHVTVELVEVISAK